MRDFETNPYSPDEARVAKWIAEKTGIGGGDDPIGFLLASYAFVMSQWEETEARIDSLEARLAALQIAVARDVPL